MMVLLLDDDCFVCSCDGGMLACVDVAVLLLLMLMMVMLMAVLLPMRHCAVCACVGGGGCEWCVVVESPFDSQTFTRVAHAA